MNVLPESYYYKIVEGWWCMANSAGNPGENFYDNNNNNEKLSMTTHSKRYLQAAPTSNQL